jgi:hypothetical protein
MSTATKKPTFRFGMSKINVDTAGENRQGWSDRSVPTHPDWLLLLQRHYMHADLCFITSMAVGHLVCVSRVSDCYTPGAGFLCEWQEWLHKGSTRGEAFWMWWLRRRESVQDTPERACVAYVIAYRAWAREHPEEP